MHIFYHTPLGQAERSVEPSHDGVLGVYIPLTTAASRGDVTRPVSVAQSADCKVRIARTDARSGERKGGGGGQSRSDWRLPSALSQYT
jgi:hypothetical protein